MEVIAEEEEDEDDDDDDDADGSSSSGSGTEFVPSAWNSEATPNRSALRSPDKKSVSTILNFCILFINFKINFPCIDCILLIDCIYRNYMEKESRKYRYPKIRNRKSIALTDEVSRKVIDRFKKLNTL